jgi:acyl carrier protein
MGKDSMEEREEMELAQIRRRLKELLVENLALENITPEEIKDDEVLFGTGLGLDSLDAVEIVVILQRNFGIQINNVKQGREVFFSIDTLARFVYDGVKK